MDLSNNEIKHIVCSGGGVYGFTFYGILKEANKKGLWQREKIKSLYGTSVGTILLLLIVLDYTWEELDNYLINRPWQNVFPMDLKLVISAITNRGIYNKDAILKTVSPLLLGRNLTTDITMKELYEYANIDFHCFTTELNQFKLIDISHLTHPEWKVIDAIYCSSAFPLMFEPLLTEKECYGDGCIKSNYPIEYCLKNGCEPNEIMGIYCDRKMDQETNYINNESSLFDYLSSIMVKTYIHKVDKNRPYETIKYEYCVTVDKTTADEVYEPICKLEERINMINNGSDIVNKQLDKNVSDENESSKEITHST
jgi:predicted acylesterase/phospholipase RssA